jgi:hypothetical protein
MLSVATLGVSESEHDGEVLLRHVTKSCKSDEEFNKTWTKNPTNRDRETEPGERTCSA